ncbi:MAG: hydrogenase maturation protease [Candidatus Caldarchaeum sp.]|nr:hydrogenase maturation protease [Candidatus Caldarchaeum sp.]
MVCLGNRLRSDDGAGFRVAELLGDIPELVVARAPAELLNQLSEEVQLLIIVDAVENRGRPGTIHRLRLPDIGKDATRAFSTHGISLKDIVALLLETATFSGEVLIFGIEGKDFRYGEQLSEEVEKACRKVANEIKEILRMREDAGGGI